MSVTMTAPSKLFERLPGKGRPAAQLLAAATGFVMSGGSILTAAAPFGVAWAGSAPPERSLAASLGAAAGYLFLLGGDGAVRYTASIALLLALRWAFCFVSKSSMAMLSPFLAAASAAVTGLAAALSDSSPPYGFIMLASETAITATASLLFYKARLALREGQPSKSGGVCTGIMLCAVYMGLCRAAVYGFSPARAFAFAVILCCGFFGGAGLSSAAAVAAGLSAAVSGEPFMLAVYCAGGLACGVFSPLGRAGCCAAMTLSSLLAYAAQQGFSGAAPLFFECMAGCAAMALAPRPLLKRLGIGLHRDSADGEMLRRAVTSQLCRLRAALSDIAAITGELSQKLSELSGDPIESVFAKSCSKVCRGCKSSPRCWQTGYNATADALGHAFSAAKANGRAQRGDLPAHFECERVDSMLSAINEQTTGYMARRIERRHLAQLRSISGDQFGGLSDLLASVERELSSFGCAPPKTAESVSKYISSLGCGHQSCCCYLDGGGRVCILVELPSHKAGRLLSPSVTADLSEIVMQELCRPEHSPSGGVSRVLWSAKASYSIQSAFLQSAAGRNRFCGDSLSISDNARGRAVMLLCDGMGVGSPAAVDATLTVSLLERLLSAGADFPSSLKLVNAALLSGGGEERLCTVDAALLDLYSCRLDIFKAGAAPSFVLRQGRCRRVEAQSLPAGILSGAEAKHSVLTLSEGDIVVMLSDGVVETGCEWVPSQLAAFADRPLEELCRQLISTAHDRRLSEREDDMTVLAVKITAA